MRAFLIFLSVMFCVVFSALIFMVAIVVHEDGRDGMAFLYLIGALMWALNAACMMIDNKAK